MRVLLKASLSLDAANQAVRQGKISETIRSILEDQKPEAAYFVAENGKRTAYLFLDIQNASELPAIAEPWFLAFNASVEVTPAMTAQDLANAGPGFERAIKKYGSLTQMQSAAAR